LAVVTPFTVAYSANVIGDITFAANTLMTSPGNSQAAIDARNGVGSNRNNDDWNMAYVDIDSDASTFNSSSAQLVLPAGADVLFAGLYWGARANSNVSDNVLQAVKFKRPGDAGYTDITGAVVGKVIGGVSNLPANVQTYSAFEDVTGLVQATGAGTYTMANVRGDPGLINHFAGWSLVVAYQAPTEVAKNLTVFNGFAAVSDNSAADRNVTVPFTGFIAPPSGDVNATIGFVTYEGDLGITGDSAFLEGGQRERRNSPTRRIRRITFSIVRSRIGASRSRRRRPTT
jgi:large repetitive protein